MNRRNILIYKHYGPPPPNDSFLFFDVVMTTDPLLLGNIYLAFGNFFYLISFRQYEGVCYGVHIGLRQVYGHYYIEKEERIIRLKYMFIVKQLHFEPAEYPNLQALWAATAEKNNALIVLKKL